VAMKVYGKIGHELYVKHARFMFDGRLTCSVIYCLSWVDEVYEVVLILKQSLMTDNYVGSSSLSTSELTGAIKLQKVV